jgi:mRNA interferase MazF
MPCALNDVVLLPFPFTDQSSRKVRPAVVVGFGSHPGDISLVPLTSRLQQTDVVLVDWQDCGLNQAIRQRFEQNKALDPAPDS